MYLLQGVLLSVPETMPTLDSMKKLWVHEVLRVFGDRLVEQSDMNWLIQQIRSTLTDKMEINLDTMFIELKSDKITPVRTKIISYFKCMLAKTSLFNGILEKVPLSLTLVHLCIR